MKLFLPDACWRRELVSGGLFLYFHDEPVGFTLHPSVSTFRTGIDPFSFFHLVEQQQPSWRPEFFKFIELWNSYRTSLEQTDRLLEPLRGTAFKTIWLSYPRGRHAWDTAEELLSASPLPAEDVAQMIDPYSASDELFSHIFFEKYLELYFPGRSTEETVALGKAMAEGAGPTTVTDVDWSPLYAYCGELFSRRSLEQLLTTAYMFRMPLLQRLDAILLSNERLVPLLASLPVDAPDTTRAAPTGGLLDVAAWEFFRQLVSPLLDPLDDTRVKAASGLICRRAAEIKRLKRRCLQLAQEIGEERVQLATLQGTIRYHIRANVEGEVQAALDLDKQAVEELLATVFADEKAWLGIATLLYSLVNGGPILSAGSAIYALANVGSKAVATAAKRRERLKASDFALLYRMKGV